jgi:UMF1 family MFS transporter
MEKNNKKTINGWAFYDWANSVYPLVVTTAIFPIFYEAVTSTKNQAGEVINDQVSLFGMSFINTELYTYTIALSFLIVSAISPLLSGLADYIGDKKRFLQFFCYLGASACASLYFFNTNYLGFSMLLIMLTSIGFWGSLVFYNAYLPEIASVEHHDKISAKGYALGYIGSSLLLIALLVAIQVFDMPAKWSFVITGIWWAGFAQITYRRLPKKVQVVKPKASLLNGFRELNKVLKQLRELTTLKRYLRAFFIYSMGVQTVMLMATLFGKKEIIGMPDSGLIISVLLIQFVAVGGAYLFSWISKKIGNVQALIIAVLMWVMICIAAYFIYTPIGFYALAGLVGLVMGGIQSLSRSTYSKLIPEETKDTASFFSFYDVTEKVGIVIGMFAYGAIEALTGSMRSSVLALIIFFALGFILLLFVPRKSVLQKA